MGDSPFCTRCRQTRTSNLTLICDDCIEKINESSRQKHDDPRDVESK